MKKLLLLIATFALVFVWACDAPVTPPVTPPSAPADSPSSGECDRACLLNFVDNYLNALADRDPSQINVSGSLKYMDNGVEAQLGEGLWKTAVRLDNDRRLDFADPVQKNVASQVLLYEAGSSDGEATGGCGNVGADETGNTPVIYQVRLKVENNLITEIESMTVRAKNAANGFFVPKNMEPESVFTQDPAIPAGSKKMSRAELVTLLDQYVDYLEGTVKGPEIAWDDKCKRYENGMITAGGKTAFEMQNMWRFNVTRRYPIIDEEAGIIWGVLPFYPWNYTLVVGEAFKMYDDKIVMIQAVMNWQPYKKDTWE